MDYPVYCEQPIWGLFFEPINTLTNLFFIFAGILSILKLRKRNILDAKGIFFSSLLIIIGIGSFAWHLYRNDITLLIDFIPIGLFVIIYLFFYVRFVSGKILPTAILFLVFFIYTPSVIYLLSNYKQSIILGNGGMEYIVALSYFVLIQAYTLYKTPVLLKPSLVIVLIFLSSIIFRQIDLLSCKFISIGTHFMWHTLNAITLYLFIQLLYRNKTLNSQTT